MRLPLCAFRFPAAAPRNNHDPRERDCCLMPLKTTGDDWLDLRGKRVCLSRERQSSSSGFGAHQQEALYILAPAICVHLYPYLWPLQLTIDY